MPKWVRKLNVCIVFAMAFCAVAQAKETDVRAKDHTVLGAMHRMGCRSSWISAVSVNGEPAEWVNFFAIRKGAKIEAPDNCGEKAPDLIAKRSRILRAEESKLLSVNRLRREKNSLSEQLKKKEEELNTAKTRAEELGKKVVDLGTQLELAKKVNATPAESRFSQYSGWIIAVCCVELVVILITLISIRNLKEENRALSTELENLPKINLEERIKDKQYADPIGPKSYSVSTHDKTIVFGALHYAKCPYCPEERILPRPENLRQHIEKVHSERLVVEKQPEQPVEEAKSA